MIYAEKNPEEGGDSVYELYEAEQEAIRAAEEAEREQEMKARFANKVPYEGMSEDYIDDTVVGTHDDFELIKQNIRGKQSTNINISGIPQMEKMSR